MRAGFDTNRLSWLEYAPVEQNEGGLIAESATKSKIG
jgi:hypothetical protein